MSAPLVVDASVASKWFLIEEDSARAAALLFQPGRLCAPEFVRVEVAAAISRQFRLGLIDSDDAQSRFLQMSAVLVAPGIELIANDVLLDRAMVIALRIKHPFQDCLYIACAEHVGGELVTADATLLRRGATVFPFMKAM